MSAGQTGRIVVCSALCLGFAGTPPSPPDQMFEAAEAVSLPAVTAPTAAGKAFPRLAQADRLHRKQGRYRLERVRFFAGQLGLERMRRHQSSPTHLSRHKGAAAPFLSTR